MHPAKRQKTWFFLKSCILIMVSGVYLFAFTAAEADTPGTREINQIERLLIEEAFERSKWMIRASHILIETDENTTEAESLEALDKIWTIRELIENGTLFSKAARQFSDSPSVQEDGGDLGFFTVFEQFYPIETAAFTLKPGAISTPFKSRFGYHLLTVSDRIAVKKRKRAAHLLIEDISPAGKAKAQQILQQIPERSFEQLVKEYSDDVITRDSEGDLGFDRLVSTLEEARLKMTLNQVSKPIQTNRGWHILKLTAEVEKKDLAEEYVSLSNKIDLDNRPKRIFDAIKNENTFYPIVNSLQQ